MQFGPRSSGIWTIPPPFLCLWTFEVPKSVWLSLNAWLVFTIESLVALMFQFHCLFAFIGYHVLLRWCLMQEFKNFVSKWACVRLSSWIFWNKLALGFSCSWTCKVSKMFQLALNGWLMLAIGSLVNPFIGNYVLFDSI